MEINLKELTKGRIMESLPTLMKTDGGAIIPNKLTKLLTAEDLIKGINDINNPKEFEALATFNGPSISRTRGYME